MNSLQDRYIRLKAEIAVLQQTFIQPRPVTLIAVSKSQPIESIRVLYELGQRDFGENYSQELIEKDHQLTAQGCTDIRWHFIGHLQTNKIRTLLPLLHCIHSVDSVRVATEISKRWRALDQQRRFPVFLEINLDAEATKQGFSPIALKAHINELRQLDALELCGLMCIPSANQDCTSRFAQLKELEQSLRPSTQGQLSMGMSNDYAVAIQEGSTHIRVGTALFGFRH